MRKKISPIPYGECRTSPIGNWQLLILCVLFLRRCNSIEEIRALREAHAQFQASLSSAEADFKALAALDQKIKSFNVGPNPYTWFTMEALEDTWRNLQKIIEERDVELNKEAHRQDENDKLRKEFAKHANLFHQWLTETR